MRTWGNRGRRGGMEKLQIQGLNRKEARGGKGPSNGVRGGRGYQGLVNELLNGRREVKGE